MRELKQKTILRLSTILNGVCIGAVASIILVFVFAVLHISFLIGFFLIFFLILVAIIVPAGMILTFIALRKQVKKNGFKKTMKPIAKQFVIWFVVIIFFDSIFRHKSIVDSILQGTYLSALIILSSIVNDFRLDMKNKANGREEN